MTSHARRLAFDTEPRLVVVIYTDSASSPLDDPDDGELHRKDLMLTLEGQGLIGRGEPLPSFTLSTMAEAAGFDWGDDG